MLQAKLHRVRATMTDLNYEGSCSIDEALLDASGIKENERIDIYNINTGARFSTYVLKAPRNSGEIGLNGAAARLAATGDLLIIAAYSQYEESELKDYSPTVVLVDEQNQPRSVRGAHSRRT